MNHPTPTRHKTSSNSAAPLAQGFTLLEVILALAILGVSIAVIGQSFRLAYRSALEARELTKAQLLAVTKMAEVSAGITPADSVENVPFEDSEDWLYSINAEPLDDPEGLVVVTVLVTPAKPNSQTPIRFELTRWMSEEEIVTEEETQNNGTSLEEDAAGDESSGGRDG